MTSKSELRIEQKLQKLRNRTYLHIQKFIHSISDTIYWKYKTQEKADITLFSKSINVLKLSYFHKIWSDDKMIFG